MLGKLICVHAPWRMERSLSGVKEKGSCDQNYVVIGNEELKNGITAIKESWPASKTRLYHNLSVFDIHVRY